MLGFSRLPASPSSSDHLWDQNELFIGGIPPETSAKTLEEHFSKYGKVVETFIVTHKVTGRRRGFAFVSFENLSMAESALQEKDHIIHGKKVDVKEALPKGQSQEGNNLSPSKRKIFVGGLPDGLTEEDFRTYFETYGRIRDIVLIYNKETQRSRGFGFVEFDSEDSAANVLKQRFHTFKDKKAEVKRALPKEAMEKYIGTNMSTPNRSSLDLGHLHYNALQYPVYLHTNYYSWYYSQPVFPYYSPYVNAPNKVTIRPPSSRNGASTSQVARSPDIENEVLEDCDSHSTTTSHVSEQLFGPGAHDQGPADNLHEESEAK